MTANAQRDAFQVSIHAPRAGCDNFYGYEEDVLDWFQFTHPVRGATILFFAIGVYFYVSIHAPRAGCDRHLPVAKQREYAFQFTHPVRGAT